MIEKEYTNKRLEQEFVAEFDYRPTLCGHTYRMVVLRKHIAVTKGQQKLFDDSPYFFYITNIQSEDLATEAIVGESNRRCDQENIVSQLKQMGALSAPLYTLTSNGAYMVMASLAWNLKAWLALSLTETGPPKAKAQRRAEKHRMLRMDFSTFRQTLIQIPTQIIRGDKAIDLSPVGLVPGSQDSVPTARVREPASVVLTRPFQEAEVRMLRYRIHRQAPESLLPMTDIKLENHQRRTGRSPAAAPRKPVCLSAEIRLFKA